MDYKKNFISIITLGSFNPAILTPSFIKNQEILLAEEQPSGKTTPVVSELKYGKIGFFTELERFQVRHNSPDNFRKTHIVEATYKYLSKLKFTPISVQGLNFNIDILQYQSIPGIQKIFHEPISGIKGYITNGDEYLIDTKSRIIGDSQETMGINCKYYISSDISASINFKKIDDKLIMNYNYEVEGLDKKRKMIKHILENYSQICNYFENFLSSID